MCTGSEQELLPVVRATQTQTTPDTLYTADAAYHSEANLKARSTLIFAIFK